MIYDRWIMNRAGLVNFWYYDEEEFNFSDGKLLLRGSNGSGKSVTMQSFIPLLLDGNKSPERLDPFGSRARKIENYLLGEEDTKRDENTAYIFMEFKKQRSEKYLTIGMGLHAKTGKQLNFWGFIITDGRRIGKDFFLYKNMGERVPLSKKELKNRIVDGGEVVESQNEYMKLVNKYLFGFDNIEDYDEMIKLLIQLRTPKLSKDFRPTVIYEIMNNSLQPLSDDDLRPMSEAIENMDSIKIRLEALKESQKAAERIKNSYDQYNNYLLFEKTKRYVRSNERLSSKLKEEKETIKNIENLKKLYEEYDEKLENLKIKKSTTEEKKKSLEKHDSYKIKEEITRLEDEQLDLTNEKKEKDNQLQQKKDRERQLSYEIKELESKEGSKIKEIDIIIEEMDEIADSIYFHEQSFMRDELYKDIKKEYDFNYLKSQVSLYKERISKGKKALQEEKNKNLEYDNALKDFERDKKEMEEAQRQQERANTLFSEIKEELIEDIYKWKGSNGELKPSQNLLMEISRKINNYGFEYTFDDIIGDVRSEYNNFEGVLKQKNYKLQSELEEYKRRYKEKEEAIKSWENKKDPEPIREEKVIVNRNDLRQQNIPFIPLYMAIDFRDNVSEEERGNIEEALLDMGILDALIVPTEYKEKVLKLDSKGADKYLSSFPKLLSHELSLKLKPENLKDINISEKEIDNVLKSILLDSQEEMTYINQQGQYGIGPLKGKVSNNYKAKFIGVSARKRYREEIIQGLLEESKAIQVNIDNINSQIRIIEERLEVLSAEYDSFPGKKDIETAYLELKERGLIYDNASKKVEISLSKTEDLYSQLKEIRQKVYSLTHNIEIPRNLESYEETEELIGDYSYRLGDLQRQHLTLQQIIENKINSLRRKEEIEADIEELRYDISRRESKLKHIKESLKSLYDQLNLTNFKEIEKEIENCIVILSKLPDEIEKTTVKSAKTQQEIEYYNKSLKVIGEETEKERRLNQILEEAFSEEYNLGYVYKDQNEDTPKKGAEDIYIELAYLEKQQRTKDDYTASLQTRYHENRNHMIEYSLRLENILVKDSAGEEESDEINNALLSQKRLEIMGRVRGKYVNLYTLIEYIEEGVAENDRLLRESDRQLFEDILAKSISKKIRAKIYHSEEWVNKMNSLMESMNTSSGLSFSLKWRSKSAETEEQLDTRELVELLKKDGGLLIEDEINKLSSHFRSKIDEARRQSEDSDKKQTFHAIMKEVLDYRKWFEFRLFFKKTNENKRELTNNAFDKFSGGEKAMAMYVPLFSAVYAKYEGAKKDCPRIISLDEAFAGVDEKNIRDMFRLLNELELNYIINSQILWGDYDTVPSLSICELIRPNNATFVTVLRYNWNGVYKELLLNEGDDYGKKEAATTI